MSSDRELDATRTAEELFSASFEGDYDDDVAWEAVHTLRLRDGDEVYQLAVAYARSEMPIHRARALDVLAQLGVRAPLSEHPHFDESVAIAMAHLTDTNPLVVHSAAWAVAHLGGEVATSALVGLRDHIDAGVRLAVAFAMARSERPDAIRTLMNLMEDDDDEVRNWATFGLGNAGAIAGPPVRVGTLDSIEIRDSLRKRLSDSFADVRDEAIWGLALRREPAALRLLLDRLDSTEWVKGDEMAAAEVLGLDYKASVEALRTGLRNLLREQQCADPV